MEVNQLSSLTFVQNFCKIFSRQICSKKKCFAGHEPNALKLIVLLDPPNNSGPITHDFCNHPNALDHARIALAQPETGQIIF
jgi:hypothetical protein